MSLYESIKNSLKEAELQSLFAIITDEARKHNNYAHLSAREIDSQDIKELTKECKKRGKEIASGKYVVDDYIYEIDSKAGITVKENTDAEYKVIPVKESELVEADNSVKYYNLMGDDVVLDIPNKTMTINGRTFSFERMDEFVKMSKGANRIHKPMPLLLYIDYKNGKLNNWSSNLVEGKSDNVY